MLSGRAPATSAQQPYISYDQVPWYRKNWFAILCFLIFMPALFLVLLTGNVFYVRAGQVRRYSGLARIFLILYSGAATLIVLVAIFGTGSSNRTSETTAQQPVSTAVVANTASPKDVEWNTDDTDVDTNGNADIAMKLVRSGAKPMGYVIDSPAAVIKMPWKYYGQLVCASGIVADVEDYPPGSTESSNLAGADAQIVISDADDTPMDFLLVGGSGSATVGDTFGLCGYPIGRSEVENRLGGKTTQLMLVGSLTLKATSSLAIGSADAATSRVVAATSTASEAAPAGTDNGQLGPNQATVACSTPPIPPIKGKPYSQVRATLLAAGWKPSPTSADESDAASAETDARRKQGFIEVESCAGTGTAPCQFNFIDQAGDKLSVGTDGELDDPPVTGHDLTCKQAQ